MCWEVEAAPELSDTLEAPPCRWAGMFLSASEMAAPADPAQRGKDHGEADRSREEQEGEDASEEEKFVDKN